YGQRVTGGGPTGYSQSATTRGATAAGGDAPGQNAAAAGDTGRPAAGGSVSGDRSDCQRPARQLNVAAGCRIRASGSNRAKRGRSGESKRDCSRRRPHGGYISRG